MANYSPIFKAKKDPRFPDGYGKSLLLDFATIEKILLHYKDHPFVAFDCETTGLDSEKCEMVGFSFAFENNYGFYVPMRHVSGNAEESVYKMCLEELSKKKVLLYNAKFDLRFMRKEGLDDDKIDFLDIMALVWNYDTNMGNPSLKMAMENFLGWTAVSFEETLTNVGFSKKDIRSGAVTFAHLAPSQALDYAVFDALALIHLLMGLGEFYKENKFIIDLDSSVVREIMTIEDRAHPINQKELIVISEQLEKELGSLEMEVYQGFGGEFKIGSSQQLGDALASVGLTTGHKTDKTGRMKVNERSLDDIKHLNPVVAKVIEWKKKTKLYNSYANKLRNSYKAALGGCRFNYFTFRVPTGRLASGGDKKNSYFAEYNIQSTAKARSAMYRIEPSSGPESICGWKFIEDENGAYEGDSPMLNVRRAFIPYEGCYFVHIDYSGQELRIPANLSGDPVMIEAFLSGEDYHKKIALVLVGGDESKYNKDLRRMAKHASFGNLYGGDAKTIMDNCGCSFEVAEEIYKKWWSTHKVLRKWINQEVRKARQQGWVKTYFGRIRRLSFYYQMADRKMQAFADRSAINTQIQGCAGDMMRIALIRLGKYLRSIKDDKCRVLSSVHDEVNLSVPRERIHDYLPGILDCMNVTPDGWTVPMDVDFGIGHSWGEFFGFQFSDGKLIPVE